MRARNPENQPLIDALPSLIESHPVPAANPYRPICVEIWRNGDRYEVGTSLCVAGERVWEPFARTRSERRARQSANVLWKCDGVVQRAKSRL